MGRFRKLHKILAALMLFTMLSGSCPAWAEGIDIVINSDGTATPNSYSSGNDFTGVDASSASYDLGNNVNSVKTNAVISAQDVVISGVKAYAGHYVTASSLLGGVDVAGTETVCGINLSGKGKSVLSNVGNISAKGYTVAGVYCMGLSEAFSAKVGFAGNSTICCTGTDSNVSNIDGQVSGIELDIEGQAEITGLDGIEIYGGRHAAYGVNLGAPSTLADTVIDFSDKGGRITVQGAASTSVGIAMSGIGSNKISNIDTITVEGSGGYAQGVFLYGTDSNFSADIDFVGDGKISAIGRYQTTSALGIEILGLGNSRITGIKEIVVSGREETHGISLSGHILGNGHFTANIDFADNGSIIAESSNGRSYGIRLQGSGQKQIENITSVVAKTAVDGEAYGIYSSSNETNASSCISFCKDAARISVASAGGKAEGIHAEGTAVMTVKADGNATIEVDGVQGSAKVLLKDGATLNIEGFNVTKSEGIDTVKVSGSKVSTLNLANTTVEGNIVNQGTVPVVLNVDAASKLLLTGITGNTEIVMSGTLGFKAATTLNSNVTLNPGSTLAFYLDNFKARDTIVDATANKLDITNAGVKLYQNSEKKLYNIGESVTLVDGATGTYAGEELNAYTEGEVATRFKYKTALSSDNTLTATYLGKEATPEAKSFSEGRLGGAAALTTASDLLSGAALDTAVAAAQTSAGGTSAFAEIAGSHGKFNTGSHVDMNSLNVVAGLARKLNDNVTLGVYIEGGNGRYSSYNQFETGEIRADGDINYFGAGIFGKYDFSKTEKGNAYVDASFGAGHTNQDYATESETLDSARYDAGSAYLKAHATVGYQWNLASGKLNGYAKYLWAHQNGDSVTVSTGDPIDFDAINSHRLRIGARYSQAIKKNFAWYGGLAYEYEFDMSAGANSQGCAIAEPDLKGSSGMAELGLKYKPTATGWLFDLGVQGFTGKRDSLGVRLGAWYEF